MSKKNHLNNLKQLVFKVTSFGGGRESIFRLTTKLQKDKNSFYDCSEIPVLSFLIVNASKHVRCSLVQSTGICLLCNGRKCQENTN